MKKAFTLIAVLSLFLVACAPKAPNDGEPTGDLSGMAGIEIYQAALSDVADGNASGLAVATYSEALAYDLSVSFENLPELEEGFFYEGWIGIPGERYVSTGALIESGKSNDEWSNVYSSDEDMTAYTSYILTLEPDDGDPAPAEHVVEGSFELTSS